MQRTHKVRSIALVAHDGCKDQLLAWAKKNAGILSGFSLFATGTTGRILGSGAGLRDVTAFRSGPLGGDQQIGAGIVEGRIDALIFFWDPLAAQPHDPDVKALIRLATVWNIPTACNQASADFLINSPLLTTEFQQDRAAIDEYTAARRSHR